MSCSSCSFSVVSWDTGSSSFSNESSSNDRKKSVILTAFWLSLAVTGPAVEGGGMVPMGVLPSSGFCRHCVGRCCSRGGSPGEFSVGVLLITEMGGPGVAVGNTGTTDAAGVEAEFTSVEFAVGVNVASGTDVFDLSAIPLTRGAEGVLSIAPTDMTGWKLNIHCPLTDVISGTVWTVGTVATLVLFVTPLVEIHGLDSISGVVTVFTRLFEEVVAIGGLMMQGGCRAGVAACGGRGGRADGACVMGGWMGMYTIEFFVTRSERLSSGFFGCGNDFFALGRTSGGFVTFLALSGVTTTLFIRTSRKFIVGVGTFCGFTGRSLKAFMRSIFSICLSGSSRSIGSALISTCTSSLGVCLSGDVILANALTPTRPTTGSAVSLRSLCSFDIASFIDVTFSELVGVKILESEVDDSSVMSIVFAFVVVFVMVTPVACAVVERLRTELIVGSPLLLQSVTVTRLLDFEVSRAKTANVVSSSKCNRSFTDFGDCTSATGLGDICAATADLFASPSLSFSFAEGLLSLDLSFALS